MKKVIVVLMIGCAILVGCELPKGNKGNKVESCMLNTISQIVHWGGSTLPKETIAEIRESCMVIHDFKCEK